VKLIALNFAVYRRSNSAAAAVSCVLMQQFVCFYWMDYTLQMLHSTLLTNQHIFVNVGVGGVTQWFGHRSFAGRLSLIYA